MGGGTYEDDRFYDLADENGILVWQDFMFACTAYPSDPTFLKRVEEEAEYNIKRLRNHASLAMWCGNNEILEGLKYWGWQKNYTSEVYEICSGGMISCSGGCFLPKYRNSMKAVFTSILLLILQIGDVRSHGA